jgi:polyferredoxin/formate hydrogenlyase subunit 6/NADH:ubiquinone oxidoreductase subunit I
MGTWNNGLQPDDPLPGCVVKIYHLVYFRRISQALFLLFFLFLLMETRLPGNVFLDYSQEIASPKDIRLNYPVMFFFNLNPLTWLSTTLSTHKWLAGTGWALAVIGLTFFLGRFFCSFICPFGTLHHAIGAFRPSARGRRAVSRNDKTPLQRLKYGLFAMILASALFGLNLAGFLDPIALLVRSLAVSIMPAANIGIKEVFDAMAASDIKILNLISYSAELIVSPVLGFGYPAYQTGSAIGLIVLVLLFLNRIFPRFWCRVLCPLGAMLGLLSFKSPLSLEKDESRCTNCNKCMASCQGAASPRPGLKWEPAECVRCFNCQNVCPEDALSFRFSRREIKQQGPDMGKRALLTGLTAGIAFPLLSRLDGRIRQASDPRLIRPPGSLTETRFLERCQRCGLCMKACPTNAIQPALGEAGIAGIWTPVLSMATGYCEFSCTLCGSVCPTGAIRLITGKEKIAGPIRIGSAFVDRGRCLPWTENGACIVCEEVCPTSPKAVVFREADVAGFGAERIRLKQPYVNLRQCVGCGICQNKCPVKGTPAIRVIAAGETRSPQNQILLI